MVSKDGYRPLPMPSFLSTPLSLWILDYKGKTLKTEISSMATAITEMEKSKDETGAERTVKRGKFEHHGIGKSKRPW